MTTKNEQLIFRCFRCKKNYEKNFNKALIQRLANIYEVCNEDLNKFILLLRKGVYPYEYMDSWERFNETSLPNKKYFYNNLNMEDITDVDYRHEKRIYNEVAPKNLSTKNLGDYHDLYVQNDTLLLANVFKTFRNMCIKVYELDPAHFLSAPGLSWQTCLKKTEVELELITNPDMLLMVKNRIRGGICHAILRYAKANKKYMKDYNKDEEESSSQYNDANNLYGLAMSEPLPVDGFEWMKDLSKIDEDFIKSCDENSDKGHILEADVEYLKNLHNLNSNLPFLPERMKIDKFRKLVSNLYDKKGYVLHITSLKQELNHGLILKKVHRVIRFNQEAWLKPYIDMNTGLRKQANNDFEKDFFKLMNNSDFGKTMENVRKHRDIKLVTTDKIRNQSSNYHTTKWFSENLLAIEMKKTKLKMNKPVYLGLSILEISKTLMYEFWYDYMKPKYSDNVKLCYMDTDSFIMHIKTEDFYKDIADGVEKRFYTSNYECDRPLPTGKNKKVIGLMKDELRGMIMTKFLALRPKTYSYIMDVVGMIKKNKMNEEVCYKTKI